MTTLNYKQLAFILDIKPVEALEKIISIHCKVNDLTLPAACDTATEYLYDYNEQGKKIGRNKMPESITIDLLAEHLNLPDLQQAVDDICTNYLKRPATKKWILCDYPEKELKTKPRDKIKIPPVLASMLSSEDITTIENEWEARHRI